MLVRSRCNWWCNWWCEWFGHRNSLVYWRDPCELFWDPPAEFKASVLLLSKYELIFFWISLFLASSIDQHWLNLWPALLHPKHWKLMYRSLSYWSGLEAQYLHKGSDCYHLFACYLLFNYLFINYWQKTRFEFVVSRLE